MTTFIAATSLTTAQSPIGTESGVVAGSGGTMTGSTRLTVFGDVVSQNSDAVALSSLSAGAVTVGQGGSLISAVIGWTAVAGQLSRDNVGGLRAMTGLRRWC